MRTTNCPPMFFRPVCMHDARRSRGMILFIVVVIIALLAVGSLALLSLLTAEYEATVLRGDEIQAGQLVQSGAEWIAQTLVATPVASSASSVEFFDPLAVTNEPTDAFSHNDLYNNPRQFRGVEVVPSGIGNFARGAGRFTVFSPRIESDRHQGIRYGLVNESSRLHLGSVLAWEIESPGQGAKSLLKLPGMTPAMADSILDWIDADKTPRPSGAELEYYEQTGVPYRPRNDVPATLEELLWIRDLTRPLLFGNDKNYSYGANMALLQSAPTTAETLPTTETQPFGSFTSDNSATPSLPWCFLLTTVSAEKLIDPQGEAKIYLNDSNLEFLEQQLTDLLGVETARFILAWRKNNGDIEDPVDLLDAEVTDKEASEELKSPFSFENAAMGEKFFQLLDFATTNTEIVVSGRINVNEAPSCVLEAVPELTVEMVQQIVRSRNKPGEPATATQSTHRHAAWLLSEKIVDKATMKQLSKRLTTGGDVYRAQVIGFFDNQGTVSRAEIVVDATVKPPRPIFSKDLTMFGIRLE